MSVKNVEGLIVKARCGEGSVEEVLDVLEGMLCLFKGHTHTFETGRTRHPDIGVSRTEVEQCETGCPNNHL